MMLHHFISWLMLGVDQTPAPISISPDGIAPSTISNVGAGITGVVKLLMQLLGSLSVIFVIVGGVQITVAAGNPARYKQGRETIIYAVVGIGVAIAGLAVITFVSGSL